MPENKPSSQEPRHRPSSTGRPRPQAERPAAGKGRVTTPVGTIGGGFMGEEHKFGLDEAGLHIPTGNSEVLLTRRQLLYGALGVGAVAAVGAAASAISSASEEASAIATLQVPTDHVFSLSDCAETPVEDAMVLVGDYQLPHGSLFWASDDTFAAGLLPTEEAHPLARGLVMSLVSGNQAIVLDQAVGHDEGFDIYDIRTTEEGMVWTEVNILTGLWRIFVARNDLMSRTDTRQVDEGGPEYEIPSIAAVGPSAFWQVIERENPDEALAPTPAEGEEPPPKTQVKCVRFASSSQVDTIYSGPSRTATPLSPCSDPVGVVITPLHPESRTHRQLLLIDESGEVRDQLTLQSRMRPMEAGYGRTGFWFSFENIYNYGEGIANLGTYCPASNEGDYSERTWFRFERTPNIPPAWCNEWFMVKSAIAVVGVHLADRRYFTLSVDNNAEAHGDALVSQGSGAVVVTSMSIDRTAAARDDEEVTDDDRFCEVRIWTTPDVAGYGEASEEEYWEDYAEA